MNKSVILSVLCTASLLMGCQKDDPQPINEYLELTLNSTATESKITEAMIQGASKIKIAGSINATDLKVLRSHKELEYLNLAEASIVGDIIVGYTFNSTTEKFDLLRVKGNAIPYGAFGEHTDLETLESKPDASVDSTYFEDFTGKEVTKQVPTGEEKKIEEHKRIKSIILPRNITHIGRYAFTHCETLTEPVEFPSTLRNIMDFAFSQCRNMKGNLKFPAEIEIIGNSAFANCPSITGTLTIPEKITIVYNRAYMGCTGITDLKLHDQIEIIGASAFGKMNKLTKLDLPKGLLGIDFSGFSGCSGLKGDLTLPDTFEEIMDRVFFGCDNLDGTLTLNEGLNTIADYAFNGANFKTIIANWSENGSPIPMSWNPNSSFWFPENFEASAGKPQYIIYIPKGQLEYYNSYFSKEDGTDGFYNFKEGEPAK